MTCVKLSDDISIFDTVNHYLTLKKDADGGQGGSTGARVLFEAVADTSRSASRRCRGCRHRQERGAAGAVTPLAEWGGIQARDDPTTLAGETAPANPEHRPRLTGPRPICASRIQSVLEQLPVRTGETAIFNRPSGSHRWCLGGRESAGVADGAPGSARWYPPAIARRGRVPLPFLSPDRQVELLGTRPMQRTRALLDAAAGLPATPPAVVNAPMTIAAPVFEVGGRPIGVVAISGPADPACRPTVIPAGRGWYAGRRPGCRTARRKAGA